MRTKLAAPKQSTVVGDVPVSTVGECADVRIVTTLLLLLVLILLQQVIN